MKILIYCWGSFSERMTIHAMKNKGYEVFIMNEQMKDYHADANFAQKLITMIHANTVDLVFSYDYFPIISMICDMNQIPYASWIYDCPLYTLLSKTVRNNWNYIFCFDRNYAKKMQQMGVKHIFHFPLATDLSMHDCKGVLEFENRNINEISFIGSLYNEDKNRYRSAKFSNHTKQLLEQILKEKESVYGCNIVEQRLTSEIIEDVVKNCHLELGSFYDYEESELVMDAIMMEQTARDRESALAVLADHWKVALYTNSEVPIFLKEKENIQLKGTVSYETEMPLVFRNSKINLNITSRTIESGIPQRVFDILACGGFCLTNKQIEIADYFEDGKELVTYDNMEDLQEKVRFYLLHEELRESIARAGFQKVQKYFDINIRLKQLIDEVKCFR